MTAYPIRRFGTLRRTNALAATEQKKNDPMSLLGQNEPERDGM